MQDLKSNQRRVVLSLLIAMQLLRTPSILSMTESIKQIMIDITLFRLHLMVSACRCSAIGRTSFLSRCNKIKTCSVMMYRACLSIHLKLKIWTALTRCQRCPIRPSSHNARAQLANQGAEQAKWWPSLPRGPKRRKNQLSRKRKKKMIQRIKQRSEK